VAVALERRSSKTDRGAARRESGPLTVRFHRESNRGWGLGVSRPSNPKCGADNRVLGQRSDLVANNAMRVMMLGIPLGVGIGSHGGLSRGNHMGGDGSKR
jgi:hypothetical protein